MSFENQIEKRIADIEDRNRKVEADKDWETSKTRRLILMFFTYLSIGLYLQVIGIDNPWLNAIVPTVGFFLSTLSLPFIKEYWSNHLYKKDK
jgi:hypothetical protein